MKQYTDTIQTMRLKDLGFPPPKSVSKLSLDWDMDTVPTFNYSIGELIEFLPKQVEDEYEVLNKGEDVYFENTEGSVYVFEVDFNLPNAEFRSSIALI